MSSNRSNFFYFLSLESELNRLLAVGGGLPLMTTTFEIELDQSSSAATLVAILVGNKSLASACSVLGSNENDPIKAMAATLPGFLAKNKNKLEIVYSSITTQDISEFLTEFLAVRDLIKYPLMTRLYNQTVFGRITFFKSHFLLAVNRTRLTGPELACIKLLGNEFDS